MTSSINVTPTITNEPPSRPGIRLPCSCFQSQCGCCTGLILEQFRQKACINITYASDDFAFTAKITMNGRVLYKNTISGKYIIEITIIFYSQS